MKVFCYNPLKINCPRGASSSRPWDTGPGREGRDVATRSSGTRDPEATSKYSDSCCPQAHGIKTRVLDRPITVLYLTSWPMGAGPQHCTSRCVPINDALARGHMTRNRKRETVIIEAEMRAQLNTRKG